MSEECTHDCGSCSSDCGERKDPKSFLQPPHEKSSIKKVIGVVSGKGGVGKSLVTSLLACGMAKKGYQAAILDGDITGPSIPKIFGLTERAGGDEDGIRPVKTLLGIDVMSMNLLLRNDTDPVIWRGPVIAGAVTQFWQEVIWENEDYMFIDMPPGTGDVPLTVFQAVPLSGIIVVTSPQELVEMIVGKAVNMAGMLNVPVLGIVENMAYFECPDCGKKHYIFGNSHIDELAQQYSIDTVSRIPIDPQIAEMCDAGKVEHLKTECLQEILDKLETV